ncbi:MAG TPA: FUSC family protein [Candidatus Acidoferrum sp.]|nr:FUSC family protein [Candidatus Acidoferrum sp.]
MPWAGWPVLVHSARTAVAAVASVLAAQLFRLPEAYWAPITTLVITQSSLGAAFAVSWQRFVGTVLGAVVGAIAASYFGTHVLVFGTCVFILGLLRAVAHLDLTAYRFGGVTLAIVLLVPRTGPPWQIALHRFAEVSIGIGVALLFALVWPEREVKAPEKK